MQCAEDYVRYCCQFVLDNCGSDLAFITQLIDKTAVERLQHVAASPFARCSYTKAIEQLKEAVANGREFKEPVCHVLFCF